MAEENNQEEGKKSPIKLILMIVGGIVLLGVGIGVGILMSGGEDTDPSSEISQIIEKKKKILKKKMKILMIIRMIKLRQTSAQKKKRMRKEIVQLVLRKCPRLLLNKKYLQQPIMNFQVILLQT
jgi:flagellar basal body-associated protein FliL